MKPSCLIFSRRGYLQAESTICDTCSYTGTIRNKTSGGTDSVNILAQSSKVRGSVKSGTAYGVYWPGCTIQGSIPGTSNNFFILQDVQIGNGTRLVSHSMDTGSLPLCSMSAGAWRWPLASIRCGVKLYLISSMPSRRSHGHFFLFSISKFCIKWFNMRRREMAEDTIEN